MGAPLDLETVLACPGCRATLHTAGRSLLCAGCGSTFPVWRGIPLLFPPNDGAEAAAAKGLYDRIARDYDQTLPPPVVEHYLARRTEFIAERLAAGTVLDVGCGTGRLAERLEERGYAVVGLDASVRMLEVLQERTPVAAVAGYADALPFRADSFDLVVSIATLHHIADPGQVAATIAEMHRVARRPGLLLIWDHNPLNPYWPLLMHRVPQDSGEERLVPLSEILASFRRLGLERIEVRRMGFVPDFVPPKAMPVARLLERVAENLPLVRKLAAHNVVVARKV